MVAVKHPDPAVLPRYGIPVRPARSARAQLEPAARAALRPIASAAFVPVGTGYVPRIHLRKPLLALRGDPDALVVVLAWVGATVRIKVLATGACTSEDIEWAIATARRHAAVDDDPGELLRLVCGHPVLGELAASGDPRLAATPTVFESLTIAILEQLVTGQEAHDAARRLWRIAGAPVAGTRLVAAPTPKAVHDVPMWRLHEIGVGSRRAQTLHLAAKRGAAIERLASHPPEVFLEKLQSLPGIGPWTANAVARDALGWADAVPVGDFHAPFTIAAAFGRTGHHRGDMDSANAAMLEVLEPFRPHRARVALLLERHAMQNRTWRRPKVDAHRREPWRY